MLGDFILWLRQFFCVHTYEKYGSVQKCTKCDRIYDDYDWGW